MKSALLATAIAIATIVHPGQGPDRSGRCHGQLAPVGIRVVGSYVCQKHGGWHLVGPIAGGSAGQRGGRPVTESPFQ